ncbi:hypothetical protein C8R45DRAFT_1222587 [Mycena sanguinolenta]|nr:hypothetical protein C8R45DRAFT_1222587 [Mycena sanguinolenta]
MALSLVDIGACSQYRFVPIHLPMHRQLTRYDFDASWSTHSELLRSLPSLNEVRITCAFDDDEPWEEPVGPPINLPQLRRLYVSDAEILDYPSLVELAIAGHEGPPEHWEQFLVRSSCSLRRLCIEGFPDVEALTEALQNYPSIKGLAIRINGEDTDDEHEFFAHLLVHFTMSAYTTTLPHLTELGFAYYHGHAIYYPHYLDMLASRCNADGCTLKAVELVIPKWHPGPDPKSLARMDMLRQAGLEVSLSSGNDAQTRLNRWVHIASWN